MTSKTYIESRSPLDDTAKAHAIAHHLYSRHALGKALVVAESPSDFQLTLYKQWMRLARKLQDERDASTDSTHVIALSRRIAQIQQMQFTIEPPSDRPQADVFIIAPAMLDDLLPHFVTLYITCTTPSDVLEPIIACMPQRSSAIIL